MVSCVLLGLQVLAALHRRGELDFALRVQQRHPADLAQVHADGIFEADRADVVVGRFEFKVRRTSDASIDV